MPDFEFGSRDEARGVREEFEEYLCTHDDARKKTVTIVGDAPDRVLDAVAQQSAISRDDHDGTGQLDLSDAERDRFDFSSDGLNVPKLRAVKGVMRDEGVDDWTAFVDPNLTVDEHVALAEQAKRDERGDRLDAEDSATEKAAQHARSARSSQCDHAREHCEHGEPEACEFLEQQCGYDDEEIDAILSEPETDVEEEITGSAAGALGRSWQGYKAAITRLESELADAMEAKRNSEQAAASVNAILGEHGQDAIEFERLEELSNQLANYGETAHDQQGHTETTA